MLYRQPLANHTTLTPVDNYIRTTDNHQLVVNVVLTTLAYHTTLTLVDNYLPTTDNRRIKSGCRRVASGYWRLDSAGLSIHIPIIYQHFRIPDNQKVDFRGCRLVVVDIE